MRFLCFLSLAIVLAIAIQSRADESLVDQAPPIPAVAIDADFGVAVPAGDCAGGTCGRPALGAPVRLARRIGDRLRERPLLRRLFSRARVGCRR
jgi:hypothetical protein